MNYTRFLAEAHRQINPGLYAEIGIRQGKSLALAHGRCYGIDPAFNITVELNAPVRLFKATSDEFFQRPDLQELFSTPVAMAFIDGMHLFEFALRDFINIERVAAGHAVVFFHDVFPRTAEEALRSKREAGTKAWTGDVWKILPCLREFRPDLLLLPLDVAPTGLLMVCGLNPLDRALQTNYERIVEKFNSEAYAKPPADILSRRGGFGAQTVIESGFMKAVAAGRPASELRSLVEALCKPELESA